MSKVTSTTYTKTYHMIYSLCRFTHVKSKAIRFCDFFCDLLCFFQKFSKINIKEKTNNLILELIREEKLSFMVK